MTFAIGQSADSKSRSAETKARPQLHRHLRLLEIDDTFSTLSSTMTEDESSLSCADAVWISRRTRGYLTASQ